jgi:V8-like Glu-specific endopeptidase
VPIGAAYANAVRQLVNVADERNWLRDLVQRLADTFVARKEFSEILNEIDRAGMARPFPDPVDELSPTGLPDFSEANGQQLRLLRVALVKTTKQSGLNMVLSATRDSRLADLVGPGTFQEQVFELLDLARREGWLNDLVHAALEEWPQAPDLRRVVQTFSLTSTTAAEAPMLTSLPHERDRIADPDSQRLERIIGKESMYLEPIAWLGGLSDLRNRVCRVEIGTGGFATGCLVGPDLVLTCQHNLTQIASAESLLVRFDFALAGAEMRPGTVCTAASDWNVISEPHYDGTGLNFALIRLATAAGHERMPDGALRGWMALNALSGIGVPGGALSILHHPRAEPMKMSLGTLVRVDEKRLHHDAPTEPGSSGGGCFNMALQLIGLHEGKANPDWRRPGSPVENVAVRIDAIAQRIQTELPGLLPLE